MDHVAAIIGDQNLVAAFWTVVGSVVISNIGLVVKYLFDNHYKQKKMRADINEAFRRIRILEEEDKN